ncbi:MAG: hydantoinase/oxoprolinase family protein [Betaproteobacteria bacterium]|nr:hydantoinase/oxoprolinase family protein [Betaproteobacteria bacterium]
MSGTVGIDVGGTFTDLYFSGSANKPHRILKVPTTPQDPSIGLLDSLKAAGLSPDELDAILHGTTIATNAVIERKGARCALITTHGFRDVLELGRRDRPQMYGLAGTHEPLVPRDLRFEVKERLDYEGKVITPLDVEGLKKIAAELQNRNVESVVIAFMHAYANTSHEDQAKEILAQINPVWELVTATSVVREYYEFERTSTAVVQGYLQPLVAKYAKNLAKQLQGWGFDREVAIMQSNGGVAPLRQLGQRSAYIVRSGPAAGVTAAARIAAESGFSHIITADMGGTSFDVAVVINGEPKVAELTNLDFRIPLRLPMIDVHTIGAGGGSIAHLDRGGMLQVGPRSAGAVPGPVAYRRGGTEPTVTDANVVLGRISPVSKMNGSPLGLDIEGAKNAVKNLGNKLGLGMEQTAEAILAVVNQRMAGRIRLMSIERGLDPRDFAMVAFGGAGPLHGGALIREVGVNAMLVPLYPGVLCALGCAYADLRYDISQTIEKRLDQLGGDELSVVMQRQRDQAQTQVKESQVPVDTVSITHAADMAYQGQIHSLRVSVESSMNNQQMEKAFIDAYRSQFGNVLASIPVVLVNLRTVAVGKRTSLVQPANAKPPQQGKPKITSHRPVYFGRWYDTPIYMRDDLSPGAEFDGPAIVEQSDTTTVVEPDMNLVIDAHGNMLVRVK